MSREEILRHCVYNKLSGARYLLAYNSRELPKDFPIDPRELFGENFFELVNMEIEALKKKPKHLSVKEMVQNAIPEQNSPEANANIEIEANTKFDLYWVADDRHESSWFVLVNVGAEETAQFIHAEFNEEEQLSFFADDGQSGYASLEAFKIVSDIPLGKLNRDTVEYSMICHNKFKESLAGNRGQSFIQTMNESFGMNFKTIDDAMSWAMDNLELDHKRDAIHWKSEDKNNEQQMNLVYREIDAIDEICNILKHNKVYAPVIVDLELLESLGFKVIDDGFISDRRMVLHNESLYVEGSMIVEIVKQLMY